MTRSSTAGHGDRVVGVVHEHRGVADGRGDRRPTRHHRRHTRRHRLDDGHAEPLVLAEGGEHRGTQVERRELGVADTPGEQRVAQAHRAGHDTQRGRVGGHAVHTDEGQPGVGAELLLEHRDRGEHPFDPLVGQLLRDAEHERPRDLGAQPGEHAGIGRDPVQTVDVGGGSDHVHVAVAELDELGGVEVRVRDRQLDPVAELLELPPTTDQVTGDLGGDVGVELGGREVVVHEHESVFVSGAAPGTPARTPCWRGTPAAGVGSGVGPVPPAAGRCRDSPGSMCWAKSSLGPRSARAPWMSIAEVVMASPGAAPTTSWSNTSVAPLGGRRIRPRSGLGARRTLAGPQLQHLALELGHPVLESPLAVEEGA